MNSLPHAVTGLLQRSERLLDAAIQPIVFVGMAALIGVITLQIVSRVFFTAVSWTEEIARFLLIWITFLGATLAFQRGRHIAVTFVVDALPPYLARLARIAAVLVALGFMIALLVIGYRYMQMQGFQRSAALRWSMTYIYAVIPLSAAIMAWYAVIDVIELIAKGSQTTGAASDCAEEPPP